MWVADRATNQPTWIDHRWVGPKVTVPGGAISLDGLGWAADRSLHVTDVTSDEMVKAIREEVLEKIVSAIPVKRLGAPSEIASIVAGLAGEESGYSPGADFSVNGGIHMG